MQYEVVVKYFSYIIFWVACREDMFRTADILRIHLEYESSFIDGKAFLTYMTKFFSPS